VTPSMLYFSSADAGAQACGDAAGTAVTCPWQSFAALAISPASHHHGAAEIGQSASAPPERITRMNIMWPISITLTPLRLRITTTDRPLPPLLARMSAVARHS